MAAPRYGPSSDAALEQACPLAAGVSYGGGVEGQHSCARVSRRTRSGRDWPIEAAGDVDVLLPGTDASEIIHTAERIRRRIASLAVTFDGLDGRTTADGITCSIGAATFPEHGTNTDQLVLSADTATYAAKNAGRNNVQLAMGPAADASPDRAE